MLTRKDAMVAKEGMERYRSPDMQLRVRFRTQVKNSFVIPEPYLLIPLYRHAGVSGSDLAIAATIRLELVLSRSTV